MCSHSHNFGVQPTVALYLSLELMWLGNNGPSSTWRTIDTSSGWTVHWKVNSFNQSQCPPPIKYTEEKPFNYMIFLLLETISWFHTMYPPSPHQSALFSHVGEPSGHLLATQWDSNTEDKLRCMERNSPSQKFHQWAWGARAEGGCSGTLCRGLRQSVWMPSYPSVPIHFHIGQHLSPG